MQQTNPDITLEDITRQKAEVLRKLKSQQTIISTSTSNLFAPLKPVAQKSHGIMQSFGRGMVIFESVMVGLKIVKAFRKFFK